MSEHLKMKLSICNMKQYKLEFNYFVPRLNLTFRILNNKKKKLYTGDKLMFVGNTLILV